MNAFKFIGLVLLCPFLPHFLPDERRSQRRLANERAPREARIRRHISE